jgi:hypothetical protein
MKRVEEDTSLRPKTKDQLNAIKDIIAPFMNRM